jgi:hypothetical protein
MKRGRKEERKERRDIICMPYNKEALRYAAADNSAATADTLERDAAGMKESEKS